jgi:hypothetical protein
MYKYLTMRTFLTILFQFKLSLSQAQFHFGSAGITLQKGAVLSYDNLSLEPDTDLTLRNNTIQKSPMPIPGNPNGSINRVYRFDNAIAFSGRVILSYLPAELNGNSENDLEIAYAWDENQGATVTTGSARDLARHQVSNHISATKLMLLSASSAGNALPVSLVYFTVEPEGHTAHLRWSTTSELNADRFEIERSNDSKTWVSAGSVNAYGNGFSAVQYTFSDLNVNEETIYYRLKMIDLDGSFAYSNIRSLNFGMAGTPVIYPNPAGDQLSFKNIKAGGSISVSVNDISGRFLFKETMLPGENLTVRNLKPGVYILKMEQNGRLNTQTFVKR